jgi:lipoprotein-releasing system permease protein
MKMGLNMRIALSLLRARLRQSVVAAAGVTFGIAMFITLISFMTGLNEMLDGLVLNRTPHIRLYNEVKANEEQPLTLHNDYHNDMLVIRSVRPRDRGNGIYNAAEILEVIRKDSRVKGVSAKVTGQVFFNAGSIQIAGIVNGVNPQEEERLFYFSENVVSGNFLDLTNVNNSIFLGKGLAEKMLVVPGDMIQISNPKGIVTNLKVIGIFQVGLADYDNVQSFVSIPTAQKIEGESAGFYTDIQIKLHDLLIAPQMSREYAGIFKVDAIDIQTANAQFDTGTTVRMIISYAVGITLLIVAGFGIYNILNMMIYEKMDSIAILKATGFSGNDVRRIFLNLSMVIGWTGGVLGLLFGMLLSFVVDNIPFITAALPRIKTFSVNYEPVYYAIGITFALITTFIAGYFPARKAAVVDPVAIIRGK